MALGLLRVTGQLIDSWAGSVRVEIRPAEAASLTRISLNPAKSERILMRRVVNLTFTKPCGRPVMSKLRPKITLLP